MSGLRPGLAVVLVGEHPASQSYVKYKRQDAQEVGIHCVIHTFDETVAQQTLLDRLAALNADPSVHGIIVQLPLPGHMDTDLILESVNPSKDVDGFHPYNMGQLVLGGPAPVPCTPLGIDRLCSHYQISLSGMDVVIVGRGRVVGKPLMLLWSQKRPGGGPTVTLAHSGSRDLPGLCRRADCLVIAAGQRHLIGPEYVRPGAVVIDVGIHPSTNAEGKRSVTGDVQFKELLPICRAITPVPGGVGPMTRAALLFNTWLCAKRFQD